MVASDAAAHTAGTVGGEAFSTRTASCSAHGESGCGSSMNEDGAMGNVTRVGQEQLEAVAMTIAASFADDPIWKWIYGVPESIPVEDGLILARMLVARSTPLDEIHVAPECGAVALWTAPLIDSTPANEQRRDAQAQPYLERYVEHMGERAAIAAELGDAMGAHRPDEAHWYLGILGTHPDHQNRGLGSAVLQTMLAKADRLGLPTFLESSNPRNYAFYRRHGYEGVDELVVADSPPLLGFWRPAR